MDRCGLCRRRPRAFRSCSPGSGRGRSQKGVPLATVQRVLRHTDPRLTTEIYGHLDVEDMRAGLDRLRIATTSAPPEVRTGVQDSSNVIPIFRPNGAPVVRGGASSEKTSPAPFSNTKEDRALDWSGRQDLNLRPPGPEPLRRRFPLVRRLVTVSQALEIRKGDRHAKLLNPRLATTCEARFVAPVSPATAPRLPSCRANRFSRSRKSQPDWASAAQSPTACASEVSCRTSASRTRSASRLPR